MRPKDVSESGQDCTRVSTLSDPLETARLTFATRRGQDRSWGRKLKPLYEDVVENLPDVVKNFLTAPSLESVPLIPEIRRAYVPEMVLALHKVHVDAGRHIHPSLLMCAYELVNEVASSSILKTFMDTGRLEEYVEAAASVSKLVLDAGQNALIAKTKQDSGLGIWSVVK